MGKSYEGITEMRTSLVELLETPRLKLLPFTLELKKATLAARARLTEMLEVEIPDAWPGADLLEALPFLSKPWRKTRWVLSGIALLSIKLSR